MRAFKRLNNAVIWKVMTKSNLQQDVEAVHEFLADAYWEIPLAVKWAGGTHDLLVVQESR
jgi:hypothetical protein